MGRASTRKASMGSRLSGVYLEKGTEKTYSSALRQFRWRKDESDKPEAARKLSRREKQGQISNNKKLEEEVQGTISEYQQATREKLERLELPVGKMHSTTSPTEAVVEA